MSENDLIIDAYAHVGLPRFQSVEDYQGVMLRANIGRAVLCSFDSSPDFSAIHMALTLWPERFRGLGVPLGSDRAEVEDAARAQLVAGFSGLRLTDADVIERGWLLDVLAEHRGIAVVCGQVSAAGCATAILAGLERNQDLIVIGGHFAGVDDPGVLQDGPAAALFAHPRFFVVFSRHGGFPAPTVTAWAEAVVAHIGWNRILWGSEAPVLFWRNETTVEAMAWVNRLSPTNEERAAFFGGTAAGLYFGAKPILAPLRLPFETKDRARAFAATMWTRGMPVDQAIAGRLVHAWLASGGEGSLGSYLEALLDRSLPILPKGDH
jgi:hypothetical protein